MTQPLQGTLTYLFSDIQSSTQLWEHHPEQMQAALARHDTLMRQTVEAHTAYQRAMADSHAQFLRTAEASLSARWSSSGRVRVTRAMPAD